MSSLLILTLFLSIGDLWAADLFWTVKHGDLIEKRLFVGEIQAGIKIEIRAPTIGWHIADKLTIAFLPDDGTTVKKDEVLLTFEDSEIMDNYLGSKNEYNVALAELKQEESNLALEQINLELDKRKKEMELEKAKLAVQKSALLSQVEEEKAKIDQQVCTIELQLALDKLAQFEQKRINSLKVKEIQVTLQQKKLNDLEKILAALKIASPQDGTTYRPFTELNWIKGKAERGKAVRSGDLILELPDMESFEVHLYVHPSEMAVFSPGDKAVSRIVAFPSIRIKGEIKRIESYITNRKERLGISGAEGNLSEVKVVASLDRQEKALRPGMSTTTEISHTIAKKVLLVPLALVRHEGDVNFVTIDDGSPRKVTLGKTSSHFAEVLEGLSENTRLALPISEKKLPIANAGNTNRKK